MAITAKMLIKELKTCNPEAVVCVCSDHLAENGDFANSIYLYKGDIDENYIDDSIKWNYTNKEDCTAILIH